jgi:hypothetical protein
MKDAAAGASDDGRLNRDKGQSFYSFCSTSFSQLVPTAGPVSTPARTLA